MDFVGATEPVDFLTAGGLKVTVEEEMTDLGDFLGKVLGDFLAPKFKFNLLVFSTVGLNGVVLLALDFLGFKTFNEIQNLMLGEKCGYVCC